MRYKATLEWTNPKTEQIHEVTLFFLREQVSAADLAANEQTLILEDVQGDEISANIVPDDVIEMYRQDLENEMNNYDEYPHSAAEERMFIDRLRDSGVVLL